MFKYSFYSFYCLLSLLVFIIIISEQLIHWVLGSEFPGLKWQKREADHSLPFTIEVKNDRAIAPLPHTSSWGAI
jgi:hypothetical protein